MTKEEPKSRKSKFLAKSKKRLRQLSLTVVAFLFITAFL